MNSYWIWNYGDYEIFHTNLVNSRRQEYGADYPMLWKVSAVEGMVTFYNEINVENDGYINLHLSGKGYIMIDGKRYMAGKNIPVSAGEHSFWIRVMHTSGLPSAYLESDVCATDGSWYTLENSKKIPVGCEKQYDSPDKNPENFIFAYKEAVPVFKEELSGGILFDFGKEIFGFLNISGVNTADKLHVSYGESKEEALDTEYSIVFEDVDGAEEYRLRQRAFRFIFITGAKNAVVKADVEYLPLERKGSFKCDDDDVNRIWEMCAYTLSLTCREVLMEAIKRDRWLWCGDAYQAFKFCNYLYADKGIVERSLIGLRGKDPVREHINTITDYSFYWIIALYDYYLEYGNDEFIKFIYPRAVSLMDYCAKDANKDGFITGKEGDWIFIDWAEMEKKGAICAEQMLWIAANGTMAKLADIVGADGRKYADMAEELVKKVNEYYWCESKGAFRESYENGTDSITRHANIFAVMYGIATEEQTKSIFENVINNPEIPQITTPYFEGYELDVMGMLGKYGYIENMFKSYWKGMAELGATTVWEEFNPQLSGAEHYAMYGNKYGKSLCHAWGASPIYLLGRYYLGVYPTSPGYKTFEVKPNKGGFGFIDGKVYAGDGYVSVYLSDEKLSVVSETDGGTLIWNGKRYPLEKNKELLIEL